MAINRKLISCIVTSLCLVIQAPAQTSTLSHPHARIVETVDDSIRVTLAGNVHPLIAAAADSKSLDESTPMEHMILHLKSDATQDAQLAQLLAAQKDPKSPLYRQYLSPQDFGAQFGVAQADIAKVTSWLQAHGFTIDQLPAGNRAIVFSGTSGQVANAFNTEIRSVNVAGKQHIANVTDPQIPAALASVVGGIVQLHDFQAGHSITKITPLSKAQLANPEYNESTGHYLAPADFSTIYDTNPLYSAGIDGTGQSIAVVARSNIAISDIEYFRNMFGLTANDPQIIIVTNDPGQTPGNSTETTLDTEWAGAIAPKATIKVVVGQCTSSSDGVMQSELYAVNNNVAPIISVSYGLCEAVMGSSEMAFYNALWQQAAAQGQSVIVSSGDTGAAGCNSEADSTASSTGVNGICSSPYATCVGGTEFVEGSNPSQYWTPGNNSANGSALSYIPETVWNESGSNGGSGLLAGGGGASIIFSKPSWQTGVGVPADGKRDVPDVSLSAAQHDGYVMYQYWAGDGGLSTAGGTSFATPAFAALVALVNQKTGTLQGNINASLYALAANQASGGAAVFHDITTGNNSVPGVSGFSATTGYDLASGLGSVDAAMLVNHWTDGVSRITLTANVGTLTVNAGQTAQVNLTAVATPNLHAAVALSVTGAPAGVTATFAPPTIAAPGSGSATLRIVTTVTTKPGTYSFTITGTGGSESATLAIPITIGAPTFLLVPSQTTLNLGAAASAKVTVITTAQTGFSSALALTLSGVPGGVTATLSATSVAAPGSGSLFLNVSNASATPGNYWLTITGTGGGRTVTATVALCIPTYTVTSPAGFYSTSPGGTVTIPVTVTPQTGFNSTIGLYLPAYLPSGVTTSFSPSATVSGSAPSTTTLTLNVAKSVPVGAYYFAVNGYGSSIVQIDPIYLLVGVQASCTLWVYNSTMTTFTIPVTAGQSANGAAVCLWPQGTFNGPLSVSFSGIPTGFSVQALQPLVPGGTSSPIQVTAAQNMAAGTYNFNIIGSQGTFNTKFSVTVAVTANSFALSSAQNSATAAQGATSQLTVASAHQGVFNSAVSLSWTGLPSGVTAALAKSAFSAPGDGSTVTTFTAAASATPGTYTLTLTGTGGGQTQSIPVTLVVAPPSCTLGVTYPSASALSLSAGQSGSVQVSCTNVQGSFSAPLTLSLTGVPTGVTAQTTATTIAAGAKTSVQITTPLSMAATTFTLSLTAASGSFKTTVPISVAVAASNFALTAAQSALTITAGTTAQLSATSAHNGIFDSAVSLAWTGLPSGVTASLAKSSFPAPGDGTTATTFTAAPTATPGTYTATLTAAGGGLTETAQVSLTIVPPPSCTLGTSASPLAINAGQSASAQLSCTGVKGTFAAPLTLSITGAPSGVTTKLAAPTMTAGGSVALTISTVQTMAAASFTLSLKATSGTFTSSLSIPVAVAADSFTLTAAQSALTIKLAATGQLSVNTAHLGVFNSVVTLTWTLPAGVTSAGSKVVAAPGDGAIVTTFTVSSTAKTGTYNATLTAIGGGITQTVPVSLTIAAN